MREDPIRTVRDTQPPASPGNGAGTEPIDYFFSSHPLRGLASRISLRVRRHIFDYFMDVMAPARSDLVLDVGVTADRCLEESNFFERLYPFKDRLVVTGIEDASFLEDEYRGVRFIRTGRDGLPFVDGAFDVVFCSAVIEHVGDRMAQERFVRELLRVGRKFFLTTPNRMYPVEFHTFLPFLHWLPRPVHQAFLRAMGLKFWARTENLNLLCEKDLVRLFPRDCQLSIYKPRLLGMPSNLVAHGKRAA